MAELVAQLFVPLDINPLTGIAVTDLEARCGSFLLV